MDKHVSYGFPWVFILLLYGLSVTYSINSIVGPLISPMNQYRKRIERIITPLIDERRQKLREYGDDWSEKPVSLPTRSKIASLLTYFQYDFLMCLIEAAPSGQNYESSYEGIATRLLQFCFATIHTSIHVLFVYPYLYTLILCRLFRIFCWISLPLRRLLTSSERKSLKCLMGSISLSDRCRSSVVWTAS